MGVVTTVDKSIDELKENISCAIDNIQEIINPDTWGNDSIREDYLERLEEILPALMKLRRKL